MQYRGNRFVPAVVGRREVCQAGGMYRPSFAGSWPRLVATAMSCAALVGGCFGGQSGGETNSDVGLPEAPAVCACVPLGMHPVHARVTRLDGGCAELVVVGLLGEASTEDYLPLRVGDTFGGLLAPLCTGGREVNEGEDVFALFTRGTQDGATCPEYRACSIERCGNPDALVTTTISDECKERQAQDPEVDCEPTTISDEEALAQYDRCDTECLDQTRSACDARAEDTQLGGSVYVAPWTDGEVSFFWAGEQRSESPSDLIDPECPTRHQKLWFDYYEQHAANAGPPIDEQDVAVAPPEPQLMPVCPLSPEP